MAGRARAQAGKLRGVEADVGLGWTSDSGEFVPWDDFPASGGGLAVALTTPGMWLRTADDEAAAEREVAALPVGRSACVVVKTPVGGRLLVCAVLRHDIDEVVQKASRPERVDLPVLCLWRELGSPVEGAWVVVHVGRSAGGVLTVVRGTAVLARETTGTSSWPGAGFWAPIRRVVELAVASAGGDPEGIRVVVGGGGVNDEVLADLAAAWAPREVRPLPDPQAAAARGAARTSGPSADLLGEERRAAGRVRLRRPSGGPMRVRVEASTVGLAAGLVLAVGGLGGLWLYGEVLRRDLARTAAEVEALRPYEEQLQALTQRRAEVLRTVRAIEALTSRRRNARAALAEVSARMPEAAYLEAWEEDGDRFVLRGRAMSERAVADLVRRLEEVARDVVIEEYRKDTGGDPDAGGAFRVSGVWKSGGGR